LWALYMFTTMPSGERPQKMICSRTSKHGWSYLLWQEQLFLAPFLRSATGSYRSSNFDNPVMEWLTFGLFLLMPRRLQAEGCHHPAGWISDIKPPALPGCAYLNRLILELVDGKHGLSLGMLKIGDLDPFVIEDFFVAVYQMKVAAHEWCRVLISDRHTPAGLGRESGDCA
jgi:hypothetical protein